MAGLAALFTRDFFGLAEKRLNDDGIFVQWFHSYDMDWPTFSLVGRTFAQAFPNSILVSTNLFPRGRDYLLVGFKGKSGLILENAKQNFPYVQKSKNVTLTDPRLLYRLIVSEDIQRLFGQGPINTDSRPRLEFTAPKLMYQRSSEIIKNIQSKKWLSPETKNIIKEVLTDMDAQISFAIYALSLYMPFPDMVDLSQATPLQKESFFKRMETYCAKNSIDYAILKDDELAQRCRSIQIETIQNKIDLMPDKAGSYFYLANLFFVKDMLNEAIINYSKSLEIKSNNAYTHNNLGYALTVQGNFDEAVTHFTEALRIKPDFAEAQRNLGYSLARQGKLEEATKEYLKAIQMLPDNNTLHNDLGVILARQGKIDEAIKHFTEALRIKPDFAEALRNLKIIQQQR
jgi:spermidine synthase